MSAVLQIRDATVRYGSVTAVDGVSVDVHQHGTLALLGPSGCGKSTLLRAVAGLEPLAAGRITMDGTDLATVPVFRRRFGLMFQDGVLFGHRTVAGNIGYGMRMAGAGRAAIRARVGELLDLVGLPGYGDRPVGTLSGGQAQRVALARALAPRPRLLLLDEPLAALDAALREQLLVDLRRILRETGTPTVFVTHDQDEAFAIADRVAVMRDGRIRQQGTPREVWDRPADAWLARFVGYSSVLDGGPAAAAAALLGSPPGMPVALRPGALRADPAGPLRGTVVGAVPGPESTRLEVDLDGWGRVAAVAGPGAVPEGAVRLRFDPAGASVLSGAQ
ncbi:ABC transporter ATP-binding protein [Nakamurella deserti]|uniref:ABC transporter ATP-binding protein n=1 Tax=Nakamurella deserti TaxID=2164074 RepID=UPI000DBE8916|nr:ABC transporter ATP-binding protein [Nakamurella deserti]